MTETLVQLSNHITIGREDNQAQANWIYVSSLVFLNKMKNLEKKISFHVKWHVPFNLKQAVSFLVLKKSKGNKGLDL